MKLFNRRLGTSFAILIAISGISAGCDPLGKQASKVTTKPRDAKPNPLSQVRKVERQEPPEPHWLLSEGLLGIPNGAWLNIVTLLLGGLGTYLGISNWVNGRINADEFNKELKALRNKVKDANLAIQNRTTSANFDNGVTQLSARILTLENYLNRTSTEVSAIQSRLASHDFAQFSDKHQQLSSTGPAISSEIQLPKNYWSEPAQSVSPASPNASELQSKLTELINRGDRQAFKRAVRSELNITNESESFIAIGRSLQTELEEVAGGGSYWLVEIAGQNWLYPTDLTLNGFSQSQPSKGIFNYEKQQTPFPQVLAPALLEPCESHWRIAKMGSIAVSG